MMKADYLARLLDAAELAATPTVLPKANRTIEISTSRRQEQRWAGATPEWFRAVPNKRVLQFGGQPMWAEFILLRLLESDGWAGVWVKNWGGRAFWHNPLEPVELPPAATLLFRRIEERTEGRGGGCWDIFAWREEDILFIESKQSGRDRLQLTQRIWLESALHESIPLSSFAIVEWLAAR
jgi:hypothetical protein